MRKLKFIILSLLVCSVQSAMATDIVVDGLKYSLDDSNYTATLVFEGSEYSIPWEDKTYYYSSYKGDIVVPSSVEYLDTQYKVTDIGFRAFINSKITSIIIPEGVTKLGSSCFEGCSSLVGINIPEGVTKLGSSCFSGCSSLASITIPESVTSLSESCFKGCSSLSSITIPEGVTELGSSCFLGCSNLTSINIPEGVTELGSYSFYGCGLTSINIPEGVTSLGPFCFAWCDNLTSIIIRVSSFGIQKQA